MFTYVYTNTFLKTYMYTYICIYIRAYMTICVTCVHMYLDVIRSITISIHIPIPWSDRVIRAF